ncbi:MAG: hypothetical protein JWM83_2098 [Candidatus Angelobacter sp.]|nr:hypothetical protein [Candidatus Angelobacter sp.]
MGHLASGSRYRLSFDNKTVKICHVSIDRASRCESKSKHPENSYINNKALGSSYETRIRIPLQPLFLCVSKVFHACALLQHRQQTILRLAAQPAVPQHVFDQINR